MVYLTIFYENEKFKIRLKYKELYKFLQKELKNSYTVVYDSNNKFLIIAYDLGKYELYKIKQQKFKIEVKTTYNIFFKVFEDIYIFNGSINY